MDNAQLHHIRQLITEQTGLRILDGNEVSFERLIQNRLAALKLASIGDYCHLLQRFDPGGLAREHEKLYSGLTTGETFFFRDQGQINLLSQDIFPELIARNRARRCLKIWSAGCSSGEEPYSLAMLLDELGEDLSDWQILILGTDIDPDALVKARQGHYGEWSFRQVSGQRRQRYFQKAGEKWGLHPHIRARVKFRQLNLVTEPFPNASGEICQMDLIVCRNVFIYLEPDIIAGIADKMTATLVDGGYLMTGHGELYAHRVGGLRIRAFPHSLVYQKAPGTPGTPPKALALATTQATTDVVHDITPPRHHAAPGQTVAKPATVAPETLQDAYRHANEGQPGLAAACCDQLVVQNPIDYQPYYLLALLALERGDLENAKGLLKKVLYLAPGCIAAYLELADCYANENKPELAQKMWSSALGLLQQLPADAPIEHLGNSTAATVLAYVAAKSPGY